MGYYAEMSFQYPGTQHPVSFRGFQLVRFQSPDGRQISGICAFHSRMYPCQTRQVCMLGPALSMSIHVHTSVFCFSKLPAPPTYPTHRPTPEPIHHHGYAQAPFHPRPWQQKRDASIDLGNVNKVTILGHAMVSHCSSLQSDEYTSSAT